MNAQQYFTDVVVPTYKEFEQDRQSTRRALLAALVLYHLLDYVNADKRGTKGKLGALLAETRKRCASFQVVEAIANGTKHVEVRGPDRFSPDAIALVDGGTVIDRREIEEGKSREFKTTRPMLWVEFHGHRHFVDVDLYAALVYFVHEFRLSGPQSLELPLQVVFKDT